jgi:hypothetical protein
MNPQIIDKLNRLNACSEAVSWLKTQVSPSVAWRNCKRGDHMLWLLGKQAGPPESPARKKLVLAACDCARLALKHVPAGELRPLRCIETAEAWAHGKATIQEVSEARTAAYAAAAAAADAHAAADAAYAYAADAADARSLTLAQCAKIVRKHYPKPPTL